MPDKPLLIFPPPEPANWSRRSGGKNIKALPHARQTARLAPQFKTLQSAVPLLQPTPANQMPEQVLVLQTIGSVRDFLRAVTQLGLQWLGEHELQDAEPDEDFFDEKDPTKALDNFLYLVMTNQKALGEMLSLWQRFVQDENIHFPTGLAPWKHAFRLLRTIRRWDVNDRFIESGAFDDWQQRLADGDQVVRFEIELWFSANPDVRNSRQTDFELLLQAVGGRRIGNACIIEGIAYHGLLAELPIAAVEQVLNNPAVALVNSSGVMFVRPTGQASIDQPDDEPLSNGFAERPTPVLHGDPIIAVLDGLPLENHAALAGRLQVYDPDDFAATHEASDRIHGTAMASLIIHGELDANQPPLSRPLYLRPILCTDPFETRRPRPEQLPEGYLIVDLVHRAVREMFEGTANRPPTAPNVRIINFSIGDKTRMFIRDMSPLARLLDWLSFTYGVLFVVSAGNHTEDIVLATDRPDLASLSPNELQEEILRAITRDSRHRRLLSPAESINSLTVGAIHADHSTVTYNHLIDPYPEMGLPSPINALGFGYRRSIKPDILMPGGRQPFKEKLGSTHSKATLCVVHATKAPPGQKVATPGARLGDLAAVRYMRGTSNAAALATRALAIIDETLDQLAFDSNNPFFDRHYRAVLLKTLLAHSADVSAVFPTLGTVFNPDFKGVKLRSFLAQLTGYGISHPHRVTSCIDQRATILGCGDIGDLGLHTYRLPLPPCLNSRRDLRRLIITLGWLTPIQPNNPRLRGFSLTFEPEKDRLHVERQYYEYHAGRRGTLQHEILEGERALAFVDGDSLQISISASKVAACDEIFVPYAIVVTLEVAESVEVPLYEEIRERIAVPVQVG